MSKINIGEMNDLDQDDQISAQCKTSAVKKIV